MTNVISDVVFTIKVDWGHRPCIVNGKRGLFHRWIEYQYEPCALVENEDGKVEICYFYDVKFCDNPFPEYNFERKEEEDKCQSDS